jgi:hypothetical protein
VHLQCVIRRSSARRARQSAYQLITSIVG